MSTPAHIMWDHRDQFPIDELTAALADHGLTVRQIDTGTDRYEIEISGPDLPEDLAAIEARAQAASPGPWRQHDTYLKHGGYTATVLRDASRVSELVAWLPTLSSEPQAEARNCLADARFIAHARQDVPALLAKVRRLETERDEARAEAEQLRGDVDAAIQALPDGSVARTLAEQISTALADARAEVEEATEALSTGIRRMEAGTGKAGKQ